MSAATTPVSTLQLYRGLLKAVRHYPSTKKHEIAVAIQKEFREKKNVSGQELERALWLARMEFERLQTWVPTGKQMREGKDLDIKL